MKLFLSFFISLSYFSFAQEKVNVEILGSSEKIKKDSDLVLKYPSLKKFLFKAPDSNFFVGFGISPIGLVGKKFSPNVSLFQFHYISKNWDVEIFSASLGRYFSSNDFANGASIFTARTSPKFKVIKNLFGTMDLSIGPLLALELIRFNKIDTIIRNTTNTSIASTEVVKLSQFSFVFGGTASQTFNLSNGNKFKISQSFYKQTYDFDKLSDDWTYESPSSGDQIGVLNDPANQDEIKKASVFTLEFSYLY